MTHLNNLNKTFLISKTWDGSCVSKNKCRYQHFNNKRLSSASTKPAPKNKSNLVKQLNKVKDVYGRVTANTALGFTTIRKAQIKGNDVVGMNSDGSPISIPLKSVSKFTAPEPLTTQTLLDIFSSSIYVYKGSQKGKQAPVRSLSPREFIDMFGDVLQPGTVAYLRALEKAKVPILLHLKQ